MEQNTDVDLSQKCFPCVAVGVPDAFKTSSCFCKQCPRYFAWDNDHPPLGYKGGWPDAVGRSRGGGGMGEFAVLDRVGSWGSIFSLHNKMRKSVTYEDINYAYTRNT